MGSALDENRKHNIYTLMKHARNEIEKEQKRVRRAETMEINKKIRTSVSGLSSEIYAPVNRKKAFNIAKQHGISMQELKSCGIDVVRLSSTQDIRRAANSITRVHKGKLKFRDIGLWFNDALTEEQQTVLYKAVINMAGDREKLDRLEHIAKPKYTADEMSVAVNMINKDYSQERIDAIFAVTELKGIEDFNDEQKGLIQSAFNFGLSKQQIIRIAKPELNEHQMREIFIGYKDKLSEKQISLYASHEYSATQMEVIRTALLEGVDVDDMKKIAKPSIPAAEIKRRADKVIQAAESRPASVSKRIENNAKKQNEEEQTHSVSYTKSKSKKAVRTSNMSM